MNPIAIDKSRIDAMVQQLRTAAARMEGTVSAPSESSGPAKLDFAEALKSSIQNLDKTQKVSQELGERFTLGDDKVSLSDVMISMQKANISLQTAVQVRNRLVSAYHDIMNMQI